MKKGSYHKPFRHLKKLLQDHDIFMEDLPVERLPESDWQPLTTQQEESLFRRAMIDVHPLTPVKTAEYRPQHLPERPHTSEDDEVMCQLQRLVECGQGYRVADTPEYIEGRGLDVPHEMTRRLHKGIFSIQDHLDLHGMDALEARDAVDRFLAKAIRLRLRMVLIIHGRGLRSPGKPVLKSRLCQWLNRGIWRKWILAYTSARRCDGGAGATYVLLRSNPPAKGPSARHCRKALPSRKHS